jgi:hypothetical protein
MSRTQILLALWVSQPVLQTAVAAAMIRRRLHKSFPAFFIFTLAQIFIFAVEFPLHSWGPQGLYGYAWIISTMLNLIINFKIIQEIFLDIFRPYHALKDLGTALFKWAALIMVLIAVVLISTSSVWDDPLLRTILVVQRSIRVVQCGMVLFLFAFCKQLGVSWKRPCFGIALGFGVIAGAELIDNALLSGGHIHWLMMNLLNMGSYNIGVLTWLLYSLASRHAVIMPVLVPQRWDEALNDVQPRTGSESLIPMFEHMVEQAFSKTQGQNV